MNISTNIKAIDTIKSEILSEVAALYRSLADYDEVGEYDNVANSISTIIAMDYILARRLGMNFGSVDNKITELLTIAEENGHELEVAFSDMSELKKYVRSR
ncbi:MAG: MazG-like family protein [Oscillospiraceae bacterium]|nr:MazG-like family protein [Oscillospiraceae bacterium]